MKAAHSNRQGKFDDLITILEDRNSKKTPNLLNKAGYTPVRNPDEKLGRWFVGDRRVAIYVDKRLPQGKRLDAATALVREDAEQRRAAKAAKSGLALRDSKV